MSKTAEIIVDIINIARKAAANRADRQIQYAYENNLTETTSHIEAIMLVALMTEGIKRDIHVFDVSSKLDTGMREKLLFSDSQSSLSCSLATEFPIGGYRADFCMCFYRDVRIVVECDGHDYHERTKEQAIHDKVRDRAFQAAGFQVFRFTGREIWRDALKCAAEVFDAADKEIDRRMEREYDE